MSAIGSLAASLHSHVKCRIRPVRSRPPSRRTEHASHFGPQCVGYSCFNDGSLRDFQLHSPLFTAGKNFPRSGAFGPWLVTPDELGAIEALRLTTKVNGRLVQDMPYSDLMFGFPELISYISHFTELQPGDVIVTGSAAGVGVLRQPPLMLQSGDVCEIEVAGIGILRNPVVNAVAPNRAPVDRTDIAEAILASFGKMPKPRASARNKQET